MSNVWKAYALLVVSFTLVFMPAATPAEISPRALNQLKINSSLRRSLQANRFIGSILDCIVRVHHLCRNRRAQPGCMYV